ISDSCFAAARSAAMMPVRWMPRKTLTVLLVFVAAIAVVRAQRMSRTDDPVVTVETGQLRGVTKDGVTSFKGVPYAAPPVGNRRWRAPARPAKWTGVRAAENFGNDCVQHRPADLPQSEDCLFVNIWKPATAASSGARLPVMFWIYGGGLSYGSAA